MRVAADGQSTNEAGETRIVYPFTGRVSCRWSTTCINPAEKNFLHRGGDMDEVPLYVVGSHVSQQCRDGGCFDEFRMVCLPTAFATSQIHRTIA